MRRATASVTTEMVDYLRSNPDAEVTVTYKGKDYAIDDIAKSSKGLILIVDEDYDPIPVDNIIDDIYDAHGLPLLLEVDGKTIPVKQVIVNNQGEVEVQASSKSTKSSRTNRSSNTSLNSIISDILRHK